MSAMIGGGDQEAQPTFLIVLRRAGRGPETLGALFDIEYNS
jgi:hypothetical protein